MTGAAAAGRPGEHPGQRLADAAALWSAGLGTAADVVGAASAALVAGLDGHWLRVLAAVSSSGDDTAIGYEVAEVLEPALSEAGLCHHPRFSRTASEAAIRALARQLLRGQITPWELTSAAHATFGHEPGLAEELCYLDDVYASLDVLAASVEEINERVCAEARRLTA